MHVNPQLRFVRSGYQQCANTRIMERRPPKFHVEITSTKALLGGVRVDIFQARLLLELPVFGSRTIANFRKKSVAHHIPQSEVAATSVCELGESLGRKLGEIVFSFWYFFRCAE